MCEPADKKDYGWKGWREFAPPTISSAAGGWVDVSHCITETLSRMPFFPQPRIVQIGNRPPVRLTELHMVAHHGTHVDAPCHFIADGPPMHAVPLDRLYGPGVVWRFDLPERAEITVAALERARPMLREGDIVFLDTGSAKHINTERYEEHPWLGLEGAEWLAARGAKLVGIDASSPDQAPHYRPADYPVPAHYTLLSHGVLIAEHMTNLQALAGQRVEVMFMALTIFGSDGAPARVVARPVGP